MTPAFVREVVLPRRRARQHARVIAAAIVVVLGARHVVTRRHHTFPKREVTESHMHQLAYDAFPAWAVAHPGRACPRSLEELQAYLGGGIASDAWGGRYYFSCGAHAVPRSAPGIWLVSPGEDGQLGTRDDVAMPVED